MKRISFFILSLLACIGMWGQQYETNYFPIMTPETATLGKFGAYPVSHYTGGVDVKIPIYTMESNGIKIPIYLQYDGSGFIPNKDCGKVGHDWTLVAGGVITRTVNGVPDEWKKSGQTCDYLHNGLLYSIRESKAQSNQEVLEMEYIPGMGHDYENSPDIFSFNFGEHHGQFMIDHDGTVKVVGGGAYKIDISGLATQEFYVFTQESYIVITTGDGTKYTFGGTVNNLDVSLRMPKQAIEKGLEDTYQCVNGVITGFHLSKIETIDGRTISFNYKLLGGGDKENDSSTYYIEGRDIIRNTFFSDSKLFIYQEENEVSNTGMETTPSFSYTRTALLSTIDSDNETIIFNYLDKDYSFTKSESSSWDSPNYRLGSIEIKNLQEDIFRKVVFYHSYNQSYDHKQSTYSTDCYRMFLDSIKINRDVYSFKYNLSGIKLPLPHTRGIDFQGFYNGKDSNVTLLSYNSNANRSPSFTYASYGMLEQITYPTGGYTKLTFENHQYGTMVQKTTSSHEMTTSIISGSIGGLRIKKIENVPGDIVSYEYVTEDGLSSGVYNNTDNYNFLLSYDDIQLNYTTLLYLVSNNLTAGNGVSESDIAYSRIVEKRGAGKGEKVFYYTTFQDYKDEPILNKNLDYFYFTGDKDSDVAKQFSCLLAYTSKHLERGKLLKMEEYKADGSIHQKTSYTYSTDANRTSQAIYSSAKRFSVSPTYDVANVVAHYYYPNQLSKQVVESYDGGTHQTTTEYTYHNGTRELVTETVTNSDGSVHGKKLYYPQDITSNTIYSAMKDKNQLSTVVKEEQFVGSASNVVKTLENGYAAFTGDNTTYYDLATVKQTVGSTTQTLLTISARDSHRNVLEATELGKPTTCYLWGYGYHLPVAKLENVTRGTLSSLISTTTQYDIAASYDPYNSYRSTLEALTTVASAVQVTLYEHEPGAGIIYSKGPTGQTIYYKYDAYGRLTGVSKESVDNVVEQMEYYCVTNWLPPLSVTQTNTASTLSTGSKTFGVRTSGGSGERTYSLKIMSGSTVLVSGSSSSLTYNFTTPGTYTFSGWVEDAVTLERIEFSHTFTIQQAVVLPSVGFTNVEQHIREAYGYYYSTATIECEEAMTVVFSFSATLDSGTYSCVIGNNYSATGSESADEKITVELDAGTNEVELRLENAPNAELYLIISEVDGGEVGTDSSLTVSSSKAEN